MMNPKALLATGLILSTVGLAGSLSACTTTNQRLSTRPPATTEADAGAVAYQATEEAAAGTDLQRLESGQPLQYYANEFNRLGYQIMDVSASAERHVYDLRRGNERFLVSLRTLENQNRVNDVTVERYRRVDVNTAMQERDRELAPGTAQAPTNAGATSPSTQTTSPQTAAAPRTANEGALPNTVVIVTQVRQLQPGKRAYEYIPEIAQFGRVTEYNAGQEEAEIEFQGPDNRFYQVNMDINPQTQTVTSIDIDRSVWAAF